MSDASGHPEVLDLLVVGGGPGGTATAFRAKELGLEPLVLDFDDLMKRIRDYSKDKLILPSFGGGDRLCFPECGDLVSCLHFQPIDKDEMCDQWKALHTEHGIRSRIGVELTGLERRDDGLWSVLAWDHAGRREAPMTARHVVLAIGRGVPRRFDIPGSTDGIAFPPARSEGLRRRPGVRHRRRHLRRRGGDRDLERQGRGWRSLRRLLVLPRRQVAAGVEGPGRGLFRGLCR